ncbi:hypothetical protein JYK02_36380 [Corallococcus macrosporus]|uniref:Uncharacterized protein n=1 Tax=Corallococcus macrosporus TaxID=35 RepID=A0ABS3DNU5_9BACT|nr:hypothetical protein [Corallococcus macrosporus]MBN8233006.1 hypothetical protein [Corallococcus macrosporus]
MNLLRRSLLLAPALLLAPMTASARPPDCTNAWCETQQCATLCLEAGHIITCGDYGVCVGASPVAPSEPQASVQSSQAEEDASEAVCREPEARG